MIDVKKNAQETYNKRMEEMYKNIKEKRDKQKEQKRRLIKLTESTSLKPEPDTINKSPRDILLKEYESLKKQFYKIDTDETLKKYYILSKAHKLGKKIYGAHYSIAAMAVHFDIPYETCRRIMSLERASKKIWKKINSGELSAFKAAQICLTINKDMREEIVDTVVKDNLSTYQIKRIDLPNKGKIKKERLKISVEKGFSRQDSAYRSISDTIERMNILLESKKENFPENKIPELILKLKKLSNHIEDKIKEWK
jgi:hypothetical protein